MEKEKIQIKEKRNAQAAVLTTKNTQTKTEHKSITEVETHLEKAKHLCLHEVIVYSIKIHITCC
jgi:hypothetical protein